jgi:transposase
MMNLFTSPSVHAWGSKGQPCLSLFPSRPLQGAQSLHAAAIAPNGTEPKKNISSGPFFPGVNVWAIDCQKRNVVSSFSRAPKLAIETGDASKSDYISGIWMSLDHVQEVIPMRSRRAYQAKPVKKVELELADHGQEGEPVHVGFDVGKEELLTVARWPDGSFDRPWLAKNPGEIGELVGLLCRIAAKRTLILAMEPTGTYGDALRQALSDAGLTLHRVGAKAAHDYAEIFDGVPSQHDGKDAAVVAELAALGKSSPWPYRAASETDQELAYCVDWMDAQRRQYAMWLGRLEGLLARHWPEATRWMELSSGTLLRALQRYGGPSGLAEDANASVALAGWGGRCLAAEKIRGLIQSAASSRGVRQTMVDVRRMQRYAEQALAARKEIAGSQRRLQELAKSNTVIQAQARAVGVATACVLWTHLGDPRQYHCSAAYRKAMGLNLVERSSGMYQGKLRISKRGSAQVRRWLYLAVLRLVASDPVGAWYRRKKSKDGEQARRALIGVMRRLALALYEVGANEQTFDAWRLFPGVRAKRRRIVGALTAR